MKRIIKTSIFVLICVGFLLLIFIYAKAKKPCEVTATQFSLTHYDYSGFDGDWLFTHLTIYYKQRFRESKVLQQHLRKLALKSSDAKLGHLYIDIYAAPNEI